MIKWISVKDGVPEFEQKVLCFGNNQIFIGYASQFGGTFYWCSTDYDHIEFVQEKEPITHWMPLPDPPLATPINSLLLTTPIPEPITRVFT